MENSADSNSDATIGIHEDTARNGRKGIIMTYTASGKKMRRIEE
jgi:hypothetical protein